MMKLIEDKRQSTLLILFAKEPIAGRVKTRLIPHLGERGACQLYERMLHLQLRRFYCFPECDFSFHISPDKTSVYAKSIQRQYAIDLQQQQGDDLGERMLLSLQKGLMTHQQVILFGADGPFLNEAVMHRVVQAFARAPLVFVPATDGGYLLIGAKRIHGEIFKDIDWSTERVMQQTREKIAKLGWKHIELEPMPDIDEAKDLALL